MFAQVVVHVVEVVLKEWIVQLSHAQVLIAGANTLSCIQA
jgi:hypothetical protein